MSKNEAVKLRAELINGTFDLESEHKEFTYTVRKEIYAAAEKIRLAAPDECDIGRLIAGMDALQHAKDILCTAVILGAEAENRKKRKVDSN